MIQVSPDWPILKNAIKLIPMPLIELFSINGFQECDYCPIVGAKRLCFFQ